MNVVQQLPQPQHLNIMGLSIFPDIMNPSKVATEGLTLETIASIAENPEFLINCLNSATPIQLSTIKSILGIV